MPELTVILPCYNEAPYIGECIESLLNQTFTDFELLILDDGSEDNTVDICRSFRDSRIRIELNSDNLGITKTLNKGLELAKTPLVARMDADDIAINTRFEKQVCYLTNHPSVGCVASWVKLIDEKGNIFPFYSPKPRYYTDDPTDANYLIWALCFSCPIMHPSVMFRRELICNIGGYGTENNYIEDYYLWSKLHKVSPIHILPEELIQYRIHRQNISFKNRKKKMFSAANIAQKNMENLLEQPIEDNLTLTLIYLQNNVKADYELLIINKLLNLFEMLYVKFIIKYMPSTSVQEYMLADIHETIIILLTFMPFHQKFQLIKSNAFIKKILNRKQRLQLFWQ